MCLFPCEELVNKFLPSQYIGLGYCYFEFSYFHFPNGSYGDLASVKFWL